jgi:hypothetical protein
MIANFFAKSEPLKTAQLLILLFGFYVGTLWLLDQLAWSWVNVMTKIGFFIVIALFLLTCDFIIRKNYLTADNSYALLFIVLFFGIFNKAFISYNLLIANLTLLLAFRKVYSLRSSKNIKGKLFDAGFWIGVSTLIYTWSLGYIVLVMAGVFMYKRHEIRNFFIPVMGLAGPLLLYYVYHFYYESLAIVYAKFSVVPGEFSTYVNGMLKWPLLIIGLLLLSTVVFVSPKATTQSYNFKSSWGVLLYHILLSVIIIYFCSEKNGAELIFLFFPTAILVSNLIQKMKNGVLQNLIFFVFLGFALAGIYYSF